MLIALAPRAWAQSALPDLGSAGDLELSPQMERRLGESIMREIRGAIPSYIDDPELSEYLGTLGARLSQAMGGARRTSSSSACATRPSTPSRCPAASSACTPG